MYAIMRHNKITAKNISVASKHNARTNPRFSKTVDHTKTHLNKILIGTNDPKSDIENYLNSVAGGVKIRTDSVLAMEILLTVSPEYFESDEKLKEWLKATMQFVKAKYGDLCVNAALHLDETTPHLQIFCIPITEKTKAPSKQHPEGYIYNVLDAKNMYNKAALKQAQTDYFEAIKHISPKLKRGVPAEITNRQHEKLNDFYKRINKILDSAEPVELTKIKKVKAINKPEPESIFGYVSKKEVKKTTQIANKKVEYVNKKIDNVNEELETIENKINNLVEQVSTLQIENKTLKKQRDSTIKANEKLKKESDTMKAKNTELTAEKEQLLREKREITAQLREIPLVDVLRIIATQDKQDKSKWHTEAGTISITANSPKFNSFDNKDLHGSGAIDLVKVVFGFTFEQARTYLADNFGTSKTVATITKQAQQQAIIAVNKPVKYSELPEAEHKNINNVVEYLIKRGLSVDTLRECYRQGLFFADKRNNAVFVNSTKTGAEIVGTTAVRFKGFRGSKQDLWCFGTIKKDGLAVITESAIDALSAIVKGADYVISTAGAYSKQFLLTKIEALNKAGMKIYTAFDNDKAGNDFTEEAKKDFTEIAGKVDFVSKDINEELTRNGNTPLKLVDYQAFNFKPLNKIQQPEQAQEQQEQEQKITICEKI